MKSKTIFILMMALLLSLLLSGCSASAMQANSWSGLAADTENAYLANGSLVFAIDLDNGSQLWQYPADGADNAESYFANPVLTDDGQVLIASAGSNHSLTSLNAANGNANWTFADADGAWIASPAVVDEIIYAPNSDGKLYAIDLDGAFMWAKAIGGALWSTPVTDGNLLYITSLDHHVYAFDPQEKEIIWKVELDGAAPGAAAIDEDGNLYVGTFGATVAKIDTATQAVDWQSNIQGWVWDAPVIDGTTLYVGDLEGYFHAFNTATGTENFDPIQPDGPITGSPLVLDEFIVIGTESGKVYAIDNEGSILWQKTVATEGQIYTTPVQGKDLILFAPMEADVSLVAYDFDGKQVWPFTPAE